MARGAEDAFTTADAVASVGPIPLAAYAPGAYVVRLDVTDSVASRRSSRRCRSRFASRGAVTGLGSFVLLAAAAAAAPAPVTVREEKLVIPTWQIGPASVHPSYPGPQGVIYPYTLNDVLTAPEGGPAYDAVFLENEYVQILILPEIGGRVHGALDKTNGYTLALLAARRSSPA